MPNAFIIKFRDIPVMRRVVSEKTYFEGWRKRLVANMKRLLCNVLKRNAS